MTGRNWDTSPTHSAIAIGAGVPMAWSAIQWKNAERAARSSRESRYPAVALIARSHVERRRSCCSGRSLAQMVRRRRGASATR